MNQFDGRALDNVKRSLKKIFFAWTYYGPEVGLGSCLFRYAWFNYPIVPEMSHAVMSRASRMVNSFMGDFWTEYARDRRNNLEYRVSSKVAAMTADDYREYRAKQVYQNLGPFRRVGDAVDDSPENAPLIEKLDPKLVNVVELLKNLQPKANASEFVTRLARHMKSQPQLRNNVQRFRVISDNGKNVRYFIKNRPSDDGQQPSGNMTKPAIRRTNYDNGDDGKAYGLVPPPVGLLKAIDRLGFGAVEDVGPPHGLPSFSELPPADYTYVEDGVYHHVHDLRHVKGSHGEESGGIDLEEVILQALGLTTARSAPTMLRCSGSYVLTAILRFFQTSLLG